MIDCSTYLCGLVAGAGIGAGLSALAFRRQIKSSLAAAADSRGLAFLLDDLQRAELDYRQAADTRGDGDQVTHTAWDNLRGAGSAARCFLYHRERAQ